MKEPGHWFIYMLECENGSLYTGSTDDIARRYDEHVRGTAKAKYTRSFRPLRIARCWRIAGTRGDAQKIERAIQKLDRKGKESLVANPALIAGITGTGLAIEACDAAVAIAGERDITRYRPSAGGAEGNPYLQEVLELVRAHRRRGRSALLAALAEKRGELIARYAFAIPTPDIVRELARLSPLIEVGAGSGYWASCLKSAGADIVAYDSRPPGEEPPWDPLQGNRWFDEDWFHVMEGDQSMAGRYPGRTLFLCWPPLNDGMAAAALQCYRAAGGKRLAYIGGPGSSGDADFHRALSGLEKQLDVGLWSWPGTGERLMIFSM